MARATKLLLDGLAFPEGPRWRDGRLWFSDMHDHRVLTVDLDGKVETVARVPACPSGLGWLPDGRLLVVSMHDRRLLRLDPGGLVLHADLAPLARHHCNDMVVSAAGRAYVGNFGFDYEKESPRTTELICVEPDGSARVVADELMFPNGPVITPDGRTLVVGESFAARLTAFDLGADGGLSNRRVFAPLEGRVPDGICLDAEGAIWVASPPTKDLSRVREGGEVVERIEFDRMAIACMLGGEDGRTLFALTAATTNEEEAPKLRSGRIETVRVDVPGAGLP